MGESAADKAAEWAFERLRMGYGAELSIMTGTKLQRVVLIPSPLFRDDKSPYELLIVLEGKGAFFYDGTTPLNRFKLVAFGFPLEIAAMVSDLVGRLFKLKKQVQPLLTE